MDAMMVASFVIAPIAGTLLALRFKVFTIIPAALLAAALVVARETVVLLQIGYMAGIIARALLQRRPTTATVSVIVSMG